MSDVSDFFLKVSSFSDGLWKGKSLVNEYVQLGVGAVESAPQRKR